MIYDINVFDPTELGIIQLDDTKINSVTNSDNFFFQNPVSSKWGVWFSNGDRLLSGVEEIVDDKGLLEINPNPVSEFLNITLTDDVFKGEVTIELIDASGKLISSRNVNSSILRSYKYNMTNVDAGLYLLSIRNNVKVINTKIIKK